MNGHRISDGYLAARAAKGDGTAFAELARRYRPLLDAAIARSRRAATATTCARKRCSASMTPVARPMASGRSRASPGSTCAGGSDARAARRPANKHRVLTHALRDPGAGEPAVGWLPAPEATDPARIVELREQLRDRVRDRPGVLRLVLCDDDTTRRHSAATVAEALDLVAQGRTVSEAARAVGASYAAVHEWITRAPANSPARRALAANRNPYARRYSAEQRRRAVELVTEHGQTLREAAAAVGAAQMTVHRWVHAAA